MKKADREAMERATRMRMTLEFGACAAVAMTGVVGFANGRFFGLYELLGFLAFAGASAVAVFFYESLRDERARDRRLQLKFGIGSDFARDDEKQAE